jgi:hypothetical protein
MSGFDQQAGQEQDFLNGPGYTDQDVHPSTFGGLSALTPIKGAIAGADEGIGILAGDFPKVLHAGMMGVRALDPDETPDTAYAHQAEFEKAWIPGLKEATDTVDQTARAQAKALIPDPTVSGAGTNLIFGFAKTATQAAAAALTREPAIAAPLFGYLQGMGQYRDLRDQGVDDDTAQKAATIGGVLGGASFFLPGGLPTKWLNEMGPATQAVTQLGAGAAINTASGMVNRYATAQILDTAGYHDLADQSRVMDGQAILSDLLSGAFFGGVHYMHGRAGELAQIAQKAAESGNLDPSIRDAAKVSQDARAAAIDRAPGIPVDGETAGAHAQALEKALSDVLADKPVDVSHELDDSNQFLPRPEDPDVTASTRDMIHEEFKNAGVMGEASKVDQLDRVLEGLYQGKPMPPYQGEVRVPTDVPRETDQADTTGVLDTHEEQEPPVLADQTRLYRGEGPNQNKSGDWWTTNRPKAEKYSVGGKLYSLDVTPKEEGTQFATGHGGSDERVFGGSDRSILNRQREVQLSHDSNSVAAEQAMTNLKDSQAADETPKMIDLARQCAGMTR